MSINHYSSSDTPETAPWWTEQHQHSSSSGTPIPIHPSWHHHHQPTWFNSHTPPFNLNDEEELDEDTTNNSQPPLDDDQAVTSHSQQQVQEDVKELMFEKSLTPSDVGKLNRLVIPKQYAEKYFPLGGGDSEESKGLLLSFEDESGKLWRFRYSFWSSSQSYVLTKGWSRYVKDKRLDAGDVVLFERHRADPQRLFIRWRCRTPNAPPVHLSIRGAGKNASSDGNGVATTAAAVPVGWTTPSPFYPAHPPYPAQHPLLYQPAECLHAGGGSQGQNQTTPMGNSSSSRVLRLFGVNMECQPDNDSESSYNIS